MDMDGTTAKLNPTSGKAANDQICHAKLDSKFAFVRSAGFVRFVGFVL